MSLPNTKKRKIFDGRYEVLSIVGRGQDSVVYHARHLNGAQQEVALKVLINNKQKASLTERLRKEALTLVSCRHKYVVRLDDFHSVAELCYLSMEYAPLGDLRKYLSESGKPLSPEMGTEFLRQALEGLEFVHATGVLHRDIKPDNILVINDNEIRLADFGLALLPGDELDLDELRNGVGSLSYLPPEMLDGKFYDSRSDLYSLGVCFYEALAGFHPFEQAPLSEQQEARLDHNIKPLHEINPLIPRHVSEVISALMRNSTETRFQTAMDALRALADNSFTGDIHAVLADSFDDIFSQFEFEDELEPVAPAPPSLAFGSLPPANSDDADNFRADAFSAGLEDAPPPSEFSSANLDESNRGTEELTAKRVQTLIEQDSKRKDARSTPSIERAPEVSRTPASNSQRASSNGLIGALLNLNPIARAAVVMCGAAVITIGAILLSHLRPSSNAASDSLASDEEPTSEVETQEEAPAALSFPNIPIGTYAGAIEGMIPGITSPLALISDPKQNKLTVVLGVEGWTPTTISTTANSGNGDTNHSITIRSNGVILTMTGDFTKDEVTGSFTNAITGETGSWSAKRIS